MDANTAPVEQAAARVLAHTAMNNGMKKNKFRGSRKPNALAQDLMSVSARLWNLP